MVADAAVVCRNDGEASECRKGQRQNSRSRETRHAEGSLLNDLTSEMFAALPGCGIYSSQRLPKQQGGLKTEKPLPARLSAFQPGGQSTPGCQARTSIFRAGNEGIAGQEVAQGVARQPW